MTTHSLDELVAPVPPYRMARPVASLTATSSDFKNDALKQQLEGLAVKETAPVAPEKSAQAAALERADAAVRVRDVAMETEHPDLKEKGEQLSAAATVVREAAGRERGPVPEVGSRTVYVKPTEKPAGRSEVPVGAKAEVDRILKKQKQLREQGDEEGAKQWDVALSKYEKFRRGDKEKFVAEQKKIEAVKPKPEAGQKEEPKKLATLEEERESLIAAKGTMSEEKFQRDLKAYNDAIAKRDGVSEAKPAEVGSERVYMKAIQPEAPAEAPPKVAESSNDDWRAEALKADQVFKEVAAGHERARQEERAEDMAKEPNERLAQEAREKMPRPDRVGMAFKMREGLRHVIEKSGARPWLETLGLRVRAWNARDDAATAVYFQSRAQNKLDIAKDKIEEYQDKLKEAGLLTRAYHIGRLRSWQKRAGELESKAALWNGRRQRSVELHNAFQREIAHRYDRELGPYRELVRDFSGRLEVQKKTRDTLAKKRDEALQNLVEAETAGRKGRWFMGPRARKAVNKIKEQIKEMDRRIADVDNTSGGFLKKLVHAQAGIDTWELKKRVVAQQMELPEHRGLKRPVRGPEVAMPEAGTIDTTVQPRATRAESALSTPEQDPSARTWDVGMFVEAWNGLGLERIEDAQAFAEYIVAERMRLRMKGEPTARQLLDLAEPYLSKASPVKISPKQLKRDRQFFLDNA